ncbi:MAG TPA: transglycosylase domain-containing protein [Candidatus Nitrosotalea sp.]|nr:transglycosylase domain-containing protein [Candidatus Nitrosotalea sp.]
MRALPRFTTRSGRRPRARLHSQWSPGGRRRHRKDLLRIVAAVAAALVVVGIVGYAYAVSFVDGLPSVKGLTSAAFSGDTLIYDRNGVLLADLSQGGDRRINVSLNQVAPVLIKATVAVEDKNFYSNPGFDILGIARAALANARSGSIVSGASTITQQLVKRLFLSPQQTYSRKIREVILAYELSRTYSKDQIMELYLNETYYGDQQYGIQAAATTFFHRDAKDLDLAQAAMLAGLPQAPALWSPDLHPVAARVRQKQVLDAMVRVGDITPLEAQQAAAEKLSIFSPVNTFLAPHFVDYVKTELESLGFSVGAQQLVVKTTLNYTQQQLAQNIVVNNLNANKWRDRNGLLSSAMVSMDPKTGQILAMVGSPDYNAPGGQFNYVSDVPLNLGSSIKPFMYGAAINARVATMDTPILDGPSPLVIPQGQGLAPYEVYNYDRRTHGVLPLREAFLNSLNIPAVKTELAVGVPAVVSFMRNVGLQPRIGHLNPDGTAYYTTNDSVYSFGPSLTLGGYPMTLLEQVGALSTYADLGMYHSPEAILQVTDLKGHVLYQADPNRGARQAVDPGVSFIMAQMMSNDQNRALIFGTNGPLHLPDRTAAAKTGTTDNFKNGLTVGFTPDLASVFWVGDILDNNHYMVAGSDGVYVAAPAWHQFMEAALKGVPNDWYQPPADVVRGADGSYFLADATSIARLPNDNPSPSPSPTSTTIPNDPNQGPVLTQPSPTPLVSPNAAGRPGPP